MEPRSSGCWKRCFPFECSSGIIIIILYRQRHYLLINFWSLLPILSFLHGTGLVISTMSTKMKGIYKSLKFITQIFVVKEREMEIGYPTDVKHVAHIGWDGPSGNGPSWMNEFKTAPDFSTSLGNLGERRDPNPLSTTIMPTRDFAETSQTTSNMFEDIPSQEIPCVPKKQKRKKIKSISPKSSSSTARHLRAAKSTPAFNEREATAIVQV